MGVEDLPYAVTAKPEDRLARGHTGLLSDSRGRRSGLQLVAGH